MHIFLVLNHHNMCVCVGGGGIVVAAPPIFSLGTGWEWACQWIIGDHKIQRISWLVDELLSPKELYSVKVLSARVYKHAFPLLYKFILEIF